MNVSNDVERTRGKRPCKCRFDGQTRHANLTSWTGLLLLMSGLGRDLPRPSNHQTPRSRLPPRNAYAPGPRSLCSDGIVRETAPAAASAARSETGELASARRLEL